MELKDYIAEKVEVENYKENCAILGPGKLRFCILNDAKEIAKFYDTYNGSRSKMHPLSYERVNEYLDKGFVLVGARYDGELIASTVSRQFPENYPYFTLPIKEVKGPIYTLGGLYVRPDFQGHGIATKLSRLAIKGTAEFGCDTGKVVGIGYEVSYDNKRSLAALSQQGNLIGIYYDKNKQEGLSVMLYRPFFNYPVQMERNPEIKLIKDDETTSLQNLNQALIYMGRHKDVGGVTKGIRTLDDGNVVYTSVLNNTVDTVTKPVFCYER